MTKTLFFLTLFGISMLVQAGVITNKSTKEKISFNFDKDKKFAYINSSTRSLPGRILPESLKTMDSGIEADSKLKADLEVLQKSINTNQEIVIESEQFNRILKMINTKKYRSL